MSSKIEVNQIAAATGSTITLVSGQTLDLSSGTVTLPSTALSALNASNLTSGTVATSVLPTIPTTKGGTGLTTLGTAAQVLRVNSAATGLEFATPAVASSDYVRIHTSTITSAVSEIIVDNIFTSTYDMYEIFYYGFKTSNSLLTRFFFRNNGADIGAGSVNSYINLRNGYVSNALQSGSSLNYAQLHTTTTESSGWNERHFLHITCNDPLSSFGNSFPQINFDYHFPNNGGNTCRASGEANIVVGSTTTSWNGFKIACSTGTFHSSGGRLVVYGRKHS
jgi:hypothetical protein